MSFAAVDHFLPGQIVAPIRGLGVAVDQGSPGVPGTVEAGDAYGAGVAEAGDRFGSAVTSVQLSQPADDDDVSWAVAVATVPDENIGSIVDAGMAHVGVPPGPGTVGLVAPGAHTGAGSGMVGMQMLVG